jgi:hypothetical protein
MPTSSETPPRVEIPSGLTRELVDTLCLLENQPDGVAESTIALLPYGSRTNLAVHGIIDAPPRSKAASAVIEITPYGWAVISACAERCGDTDGHPTSRHPGRRSLLQRWRVKAAAADRMLKRRLEKARSHDPHPTP